MTVQSQLSRHQPKAPIGKAKLLAMKARAWVDHGLLLASPSQFANPVDRQMVRYLGERLYGKRVGDAPLGTHLNERGNHAESD